jgi:hypothetical protein
MLLSKGYLELKGKFYFNNKNNRIKFKIGEILIASYEKIEKSTPNDRKIWYIESYIKEMRPVNQHFESEEEVRERCIEIGKNFIHKLL